jgi:hypothetical protein
MLVSGHWIEPITGTAVRVTTAGQSRVTACEGGTALTTTQRVFLVEASSIVRLSGVSMSFGNETFHSLECLLAYTKGQRDPDYGVFGKWAKATLPRTP